jgi:type II secretory pathway component PulM
MRLKKRDLILLGVVVPLAIVALFWWFHARPASQRLAEVRTEAAQTRDQVAVLQATLAELASRQPNLAGQAAEELRLAKAVPASLQVPAALVQLERLAQRANVKLTSVQVGASTAAGALQSTTVSLNVEGRFFDVDDFLYRLHRQVQRNRSGRLVVRGRLIAAKDISLTPGGPAQGGAAVTPTPSLTAAGGIQATIQAVIFSTVEVPAGTSPATAGGTSQ